MTRLAELRELLAKATPDAILALFKAAKRVRNCRHQYGQCCSACFAALTAALDKMETP